MATYYLNADTGNDSTGAGTSASPWLTVAKALTVTTNGDTIYLQNSITHFTWASVNIYVTLTIQGQSIAGAVLDAGGTYASWGLNNNITLLNLRFTNNIVTSAGTYRQFACGSITITATNCQWDNCVVYNDGGTGNGGLFNAADLVFNCTSCIFANITGFYDVNAKNCLIRCSGTLTANFTNVTVFLNGTATTNLPYVFDPSSIYATLLNCIFQNSGAGTVYLNQYTVYSQSLTYCNFYGITPYNLTAGTGCISADSLFVDPANNNFNLRPTSPCISTGTIF